MTVSRISSVRLVGISCSVPETQLSIADSAAEFGLEQAKKISSSIGVKNRHIATDGICTSDLCESAAERLLSEIGWRKESIDAVIFVSQTPDYILPATSCTLHGRLGLSKHCAALDLSLGCSGYVYGLWMASLLIENGAAKRVLLLAGDTISRLVSSQDRSTAPLFGDAGTATALEYDPDSEEMTYVFGTDGTGWNHLIVPAGGFRKPSDQQTAQKIERDDGSIRSEEDLFMDGAEIFTFTLREIPKLIKSTLSEAGWDPDSVDAYVFHQANEFMLKHLAKRLRLPEEKVILAMEQYGNTSSASVPLALTSTFWQQSKTTSSKLILAGFGVGLSWGAVALTVDNLVFPEIIHLPQDHIGQTTGE